MEIGRQFGRSLIQVYIYHSPPRKMTQNSPDINKYDIHLKYRKSNQLLLSAELVNLAVFRRKLNLEYTHYDLRGLTDRFSFPLSYVEFWSLSTYR